MHNSATGNPFGGFVSGSPRPGASPAIPPPPTPEGCVGFAVESLEKQIHATGEMLAEVYRRLERVLIPDDTGIPVDGKQTPADPRACPLTNTITALDHRLAGIRHGMEELLRRINL